MGLIAGALAANRLADRYRLAVVSFVFLAAMAPETKDQPLEAILMCWENGAKWPSEHETLAILGRQRRGEREPT